MTDILPALRTVFGDFVSREKARELDALLRPIYEREAAETCRPLIRDIEEHIIAPRDAEIARLRGLLAEAGKVLEPFASESRGWDFPHEYDDTEELHGDVSLKVGALRAARDLSTRIEKEIGNG